LYTTFLQACTFVVSEQKYIAFNEQHRHVSDCFVVMFACSFHGCIHNLTLNEEITSLDTVAESDRDNDTRLPVALCPADIVESLSVPCGYQVDACVYGPCAVNSTCIPTTSGHYTCLCPPGSTGNRCQYTDICPLSCLYGGTCTWMSRGARCSCPAGRTGPRCETDIDECASLPCVNGGTCYQSGRTVEGFQPGYLCVCPASYRGVDCELGVCDSSPCGLGGLCLPDNDEDRGYSCQCLAGFEGPLCGNDLRRCASSPCHGNATCINSTSNDDYSCLCSPGFTGQWAE